MLLGNYAVLNKLIGRTFAFTSLSDSRANFNKSSSNRDLYFSGANSGSSVPFNYLPPYCWIMTYKSMYLLQSGSTAINGSGLMTSNIKGNYPFSTTINGNSTLSATGITVASGVTTTAYMNATLTTYTILSPENLSNSIWNSASGNYNSGGTTGFLLNETDKNSKTILGLSL